MAKKWQKSKFKNKFKKICFPKIRPVPSLDISAIVGGNWA